MSVFRIEPQRWGAVGRTGLALLFLSTGACSLLPFKPSHAKPFNVLDYGKTATDVGAMARDLNALLQSADKSAPAIAKWSQQTGEDLKWWITPSGGV